MILAKLKLKYIFKPTLIKTLIFTSKEKMNMIKTFNNCIIFYIIDKLCECTNKVS